ncbi:MAG: hypothetical protein JNL28_02560 [Planctomycetes bacterium]|nr:hypothetical protein [Planctomycetota bacterium]
MTDAIATPTPKKPFKWGFASAALVIFTIMIAGQFVGTIIEGLRQPGEWGGREKLLAAVLAGFVVSSAAFVVMQWSAVLRFFRTMNVGVSLVSISLLAVFAGVLVPQIDNFEDSTERVPSISDISDDLFYAYLALPDETDANLSPEQRAKAQARADEVLKGLDGDQRARLRKYRAGYNAFRWAEGYFIYHLVHPYGIGMPKPAPLPAQVVDGLDRYGKKYGREERDNREKQMKAAFNGRTVSQEIGAMIRRNESLFRSAFDISTTLHLNRAYKSHWFATLLGMLFVGVFFNTFKGRPSTWISMRKIGFFTVHLGVMTLLIGGAISKIYTVRGIMHMDLREGPTDEFWAYFDRTKLRGLPFHLKLDRFARRDWKTLEVGFPAESFSSQPPQYTLWPGRKVDLDFAPDAKGVERPRIRLEVLSVHERARVEPSELVEGGPDAADSLGPIATLSVTTPQSDGTGASGASTRKYFLSPERSELRLMFDPAVRFRMSSDFSDDIATAHKLLREVDDGRVGWLQMRVAAAGGVEPMRVPIKVGDTVAGPGGYSLRVTRATPTFRFDRNTMKEVIDDQPIAEQYPSNPAVILEITHKDGGVPEERPILERLDYEDAGLQKGFRFSELAVNFVWDPWNAPGPERRVFHWDKSGRATIVAPDGSAVPVAVGTVLPLPGDTRVHLEKVMLNARVERNIVLDPAAPIIDGPHFDSSFYSTDPTGVEVRVTTNPETPSERSEVVTLASTETVFANYWSSPDKRFYLHYFENDRAQPFEWRSVLSVWGRDANGKLSVRDAGSEAEREIRVNDYFKYAGYRFFQTNAVPQLPTYSGIGVVYDPGIPTVLVGMYLTILGTLLAFILRPIAEAYGKKKKESEAPPQAV